MSSSGDPYPTNVFSHRSGRAILDIVCTPDRMIYLLSRYGIEAARMKHTSDLNRSCGWIVRENLMRLPSRP